MPAKAKPKARTKPAAAPVDASAKIDALIAGIDDWRGERLAEIRRLVHEADPDVVEEWKWMGTPVWSNQGMYALANPHKGKVKLTLFHGAHLPDPKKLFNAGLDGNKWRAIDFEEHDRVDKPALKALLRAAVAYNKANEVPKSKGSRGAPKTAAKKAAAKAAPKLLSGGNPQIAKGDGDGPVQAYIAAMPEWKQDVGRRLDALVEKTVPGVRKAVKWNSPFYGVEGQGWFLSFHVFTRYVKVTFFQGASLKPVPPGGTGKEARWVDVHEDGFDEKQMAKWIKQAAAIPGWIP